MVDFLFILYFKRRSSCVRWDVWGVKCFKVRCGVFEREVREGGIEGILSGD